jgi:hypothetical protein
MHFVMNVIQLIVFRLQLLLVQMIMNVLGKEISFVFIIIIISNFIFYLLIVILIIGIKKYRILMLLMIIDRNDKKFNKYKEKSFHLVLVM